MPILANRDICASAGQCVRNAEEIFDQDNQGVVVVLNHNPGPELIEKVKNAVSFCPSGAISYIESEK